MNQSWIAIILKQGILQTPNGIPVKIHNNLVTIGSNKPIKLDKLLPQLVKTQRRQVKNYLREREFCNG